MLVPGAWRRALNLTLDALFVVWVAQIMLTGNIVPARIAQWLQPPPPVAVAIDPAGAPLAPAAPIMLGDEEPGET